MWIAKDENDNNNNNNNNNTNCFLLPFCGEIKLCIAADVTP